MTIAELQPGEFPRVLSLYRAAGMCFPLISAVIQGKQCGQVFADSPESPRSAVVTDFGFTFFVGVEKDQSFDAGLARLFATADTLRPSYLLWYSPPANWQSRFDALGTDLYRRRDRVRFVFREDRAVYLNEPAQCPAGFELKFLDADLVPRTDELGVNLGSRFWSTDADFIESSLGFCLIKDGKLVSLCYAAAVVDGLAEVDVVTHPDYRSRGLANVVAQQFIRECLHRRIIPTWDCFLHNLGSTKLAERLGFVQANSYPLYSFNIPVEFAYPAIQ
jgi:RimJ/RimL family protein N-acetyltransferase